MKSSATDLLNTPLRVSSLLLASLLLCRCACEVVRDRFSKHSSSGVQSSAGQLASFTVCLCTRGVFVWPSNRAACTVRAWPAAKTTSHAVWTVRAQAVAKTTGHAVWTVRAQAVAKTTSHAIWTVRSQAVAKTTSHAAWTLRALQQRRTTSMTSMTSMGETPPDIHDIYDQNATRLQ